MTASRSIVRSILKITAIKGIGLILTVAMTTLQAAAFGATASADAFFFARQTLSNATSVFEGWLQKMLVPAFVADLADRPSRLRRRATGLALRIGLLTLAGAGLGWIAAPMVVNALAPGFDAERHRLAVTLFRILVFGVPVSLVAALFAALEFSRKRFGLATFASLMPRITGLAAFAVAGLAITVAAFSVWVLAGMCIMAVMMAYVGMRSLAQVDLANLPDRSEARPAAGRQRGLSVAVMFLGQIALGWVNGAVASFGTAGTVALMFLGLRLINAAPAMANNAVSTVYYTEYAEDSGPSGQGRLAADVAGALRLSYAFAIPTVGLFLTTAEPLVRFLLERGAFEGSDTRVLSAFVMAMAPSLLLNAVNAIYGVLLLADPDRSALGPLTLSAVSAVAIRLGLGVALVPAYGLTGLAVAILASSVALVAPLVWTVHRRIGSVLRRADWSVLLRLTLAAGLAGLFPLLVDAHALILCAGYGVLYLGLAALFRVPEITERLHA